MRDCRTERRQYAAGALANMGAVASVGPAGGGRSYIRRCGARHTQRAPVTIPPPAGGDVPSAGCRQLRQADLSVVMARRFIDLHPGRHWTWRRTTRCVACDKVRSGRTDRQALVGLSLAAAVAWLGAWFHNLRESAGTNGLTADTAAELVVLVVLIALTWCIPHALWPRAILLGCALVWCVGGTMSVLPLPIWPWIPEQSVSHFATHILVVGAQSPLIVLTLVHVRRLSRG
jgi:hypothetical protein